MPIYQCRFRDRDNTVIRREQADLSDDAAAIGWGKVMCARHKGHCEVFRDGRLVKAIEPAP